MTGDGAMLIAHLQERIDEDRLVAALASIFRLSRDSVAELEQADDRTKLPYQVFQRPRGFLTSVEVYPGRERLPTDPRNDAGFARLLAKHLQIDAAVVKRDSGNGWFVIHPDGTASEGTDTGLEDDALELENIRDVPPAAIEFFR